MFQIFIILIPFDSPFQELQNGAKNIQIGNKLIHFRSSFCPFVNQLVLILLNGTNKMTPLKQKSPFLGINYIKLLDAL